MNLLPRSAYGNRSTRSLRGEMGGKVRSFLDRRFCGKKKIRNVST